MFKKFKEKAKEYLAAALALALLVTVTATATEITEYPLEDDYLQELTQTLGDQATDLTINVDTTPVYSPTTTNTFVMIEPGTARQEVVIIDSYDSGASTMTVASSGRGQDLYLGDSRSIKIFEHPAGSEIMISDNFVFWEEITTAVTSKANIDDATFTGSHQVPVFADSTARDADITSPANGMVVYNTSDGKFQDYTGGAWVDRESGGTFANASATVAGKVEMATAAELAAGTATGATGAALVVAPDNAGVVNTSAGAGDAGKWIKLDANGEVDETMLPITVTVAELDQLTGISAAVTDTNLNILTAGAASNADSLHAHTNPALDFTAIETISTDDAVVLMPVEVEWYDQLTDVNLALGDSNTRRKYAVAFTPTVTVSAFTDLKFRAAEAVNGATALGDLTISIETDNAGEPSGSTVTNATETISQVTQRTWNTTLATRTATWDGNVALTDGTTYWLVFEVAATDVANYLNFGQNETYDENYATFTRLTFDLDAGTWGGSVTNATPFFWGSTESVPLGMGLVPTDANFGGRTWGFVGFAKAGGAAQASIDVYYDIIPDLTLEPSAKYYLSSDVGAITTSPPIDIYDDGVALSQFSYKIGRAIDATNMKIELGEKRVTILEDAGIAATTVRQFIVWFNPEIVRVSASQNVTNNDGSSQGLILSNGQDMVAWMTSSNSGSGSGTSSGDITNSIKMTIGGNGFAGVGSAFTRAGFTYTFTESGTATMYAIIEVSG